ncbi:hypothetical protein [Hymenobacter daecheongensis]|uniref:hypothetical protein n=1 Tax=Hymenobacter daecheongensis TaxID=496053 RepID=UPI000932A27E|nr:hypothetical protein [Hymenobacter daecheongensis]
MKKLLLISLLLSVGFAGCKKAQLPTLPCVSGTLLGTTCDGAYLVQVDTTSQQAIGKPVDFRGDAGPALTGSAIKFRTYRNVVILYAAILPAEKRGQLFYFQYQPGSTEIPVACSPSALAYEAPRYLQQGASSVSSCSAFLPE